MKNEEQKIKSTYYWASWRRVSILSLIAGLVVLCVSFLGGIHSKGEFIKILIIAFSVAMSMWLIVGITFLRLKGETLTYINFPSVTSMPISDIKAIVLVPRFFFTKKVTAVQIERKNPRIFPGFLISRDAFPDETIAAIVSHLKQLNPTIALDEGIQKILEAQKQA